MMNMQGEEHFNGGTYYSYHANGPCGARMILQDWIRPWTDPSSNIRSEVEEEGEYLLIGNLNFSTPCDRIEQLAQSIAGPIKSIVFYFDDNGQYNGKCRMEFQRRGACLPAFEGLNRKIVDGRKLAVKMFSNGQPYHPKAKKPNSFQPGILIRNLSYKVTQDDLKGLLEPFGDRVEWINIHRDPNGKPIGHASVGFASMSDAEEAIRLLHDKKHLGRLLKLSPHRIYHKEGSPTTAKSEAAPPPTA